MVKVRFEIVSADFPLDEDFIYAATIGSTAGLFYNEDGVPLVVGINTPSREQLAQAEAEAQSPCLKCDINHRPWERCSRFEGERLMAKDKSEKKKDKAKKGKKGKSADVVIEETVNIEVTTSGVDPAALDSIVTDLSDVLGRLRGLHVKAGDSDTPTPEPEKEKKKGKKKDKADDDPIDATVTYTEKQLKKIGEGGTDGRKELVGILTSLDVPESEMKNKRWGTLVSMILTKQEEANSGDAGEFTADSTSDGKGEGWGDDEDVPPADKKEKKGKKKAKKPKK